MPITLNGTSGITFPNNSVQAVAAGGSEVQTFNSSGTWTKPSFGAMARIQVWGGGGGGGRSSGGGGGGSGGGYNEITLPLSSLGATVSVTIGAGGAGRTASTGNGTTGGQTSFGASCTAYGGGGGVGSESSGAFSGSGGGGQTSAGVAGTFSVSDGGLPGGPILYTGTSPDTAQGQGGRCAVDFGGPGLGGFWTGGGSAGSYLYDYYTGQSGNSVYGGGAGTAAPSIGTSYKAAGTSVYGGNGGGIVANVGQAGTQPAGGGGGSRSANNGGNGAAGRVVITVW
jgi:hypothetical protein